MKIVLLIFGIGTLARAQSDPRNSFTFSGGIAIPVYSNCCSNDTGVSLGVTYGYRVLPFLQLEAGFLRTGSTTPEIRGANYDIKPDDRIAWVPFGVRGILPVRHRLELSATAGGLYENYSVSNSDPAGGLISRDGWGWHAGLSAAVAVDRKHRFWIGGSPQFFFVNTNNGYTHERWFMLSGDLGVRF